MNRNHCTFMKIENWIVDFFGKSIDGKQTMYNSRDINNNNNVIYVSDNLNKKINK